MKKLFKTVLSLLMILGLNGALVGCSSSSSEETSTDDETTEAISDELEEIPEVDDIDGEGVDEDAINLYMDAYEKLLDEGYYVEMDENCITEIWYDSDNDNYYGVLINSKSSGINIPNVGIFDKNEENYYAAIVDLDGTVQESISTESAGFQIEYKSKANSIYTYFNTIDEKTNTLLIQSEKYGSYDVIYYRYAFNAEKNYEYRAFIADNDIIQIQYGAYNDDGFELDSVYDICDVGAKSADDFDFDTLKEEYSSYEGLTADEIQEKIDEAK